ncbi:MAG: glycosyl hydrolase [Anaerolineaceae bacterium]|nr:glycosyl hydrolase [Anaerolineaceae bacterium]
MKKITFIIKTLFFAFLLTSFLPIPNNNIKAQTTSDNTVFLPLVINNYYNGFSTSEKLIGIYMQQYWTKDSVPTFMTQADNLAGKKHSISGWFIDINDLHFRQPPNEIKSNNFYGQLESLWNNGYFSFVNINSTATAFEIASGNFDNQLREMARVYKIWINLGGNRKAFLAPLPEMNGVNSNGIPWASYGGDPINFELAYQRILNIFYQSDLSKNDFWWVFAPNGWSKIGHEFEKYYPGDELVDIIGFSSYNYGYCFVASPYQRWENFDTLYEPYLSRISIMAPNKPVIISQTGTTAEYLSSGEVNVIEKNKWLVKNYEYVSKQPQILGILYYDFDQSSWECNWKVTTGGNFSGYREGAAYPAFQYLNTDDLISIIP